MTDIILTKSQGKAVSAIKEWFLHPRQQVFRLFGFAGTGKTTIIKYVIGELGLGVDDVVFAAFTGKAASVMRTQGLPATTIHSLIYRVRMATVDEIELEENILADMISRKAKTSEIKEQKLRLASMKKPSFFLNDDSLAAVAGLIVLDEVSMVDERLAGDLLSFGTPILVIGDPGQLPPIQGPGFFTGVKPDVMLTRIHRQAADSPIIRLATMARMGEHIPFGRFGKGVKKVEQINKRTTYLKYDQVICGKNVTRERLNRLMRKQAGFSGPIPTGPDEKVICLTNRHECGLINGMMLKLDNIEESGNYWIKADIYDEDDDRLIRPQAPLIYKGNFLNHFEFKKTRIEDDWRQRLGFLDMTYAWAITCHKAQGSQWPKVMVIDESRVWRGLERRQWLYTAITRAQSRLTIVE